MNLHEIKKEREVRQSAMFERCRLFFAFSTEQFNENKTPLKEGEKYVHIGAGGYMPNSEVKNFLDGTKEIKKWYKDTVKANKLRRENIIYELGNHEAWYTGEIEPTLSALGEDYTEAEVKQIYNEEYEKQTADI